MPAHNAHLRTHAPCALGARVLFTSLCPGGESTVPTHTLAHNLNCAGVSAASASLKVKEAWEQHGGRQGDARSSRWVPWTARCPEYGSSEETHFPFRVPAL